jgi:hypothetical protein
VNGEEPKMSGIVGSIWKEPAKAAYEAWQAKSVEPRYRLRWAELSDLKRAAWVDAVIAAAAKMEESRGI